MKQYKNPKPAARKILDKELVDELIYSMTSVKHCGNHSVFITQEGHVVTGKPFLYPELSTSY